MDERKLEIARGALSLGTIPETEVRELLEVRFLEPTDLFRANEGDPWKPLSALDAPAAEPAASGSLVNRILPAARSIIGATADAARAVKDMATRQKDQLGDVTTGALESFLPQIRAIVSRVSETPPFRLIKSGVQDDDFMRKLFGAAYDCLPRPVQRFVAEERFIAFCMQHRQKLVSTGDEQRT
jgi:hypothetical protein